MKHEMRMVRASDTEWKVYCTGCGWISDDDYRESALMSDWLWHIDFYSTER